MIKRNILLGLVLTLLLAVVGTGCGGNDWAAKVNGEVITMADLDERFDFEKEQYSNYSGIDFSGEQGVQLGKELRRKVLDQMVNELLCLQAAKEEEIVVTDEQLQDELDKQYELFGGKEEFLKKLKEIKMSEENYQEQLKTQMVIQELGNKISCDVTVSEKMAADYYQENLEIFNHPEQVKVSHILVESKDEADVLIGKLSQGEDFTKLVQDNSIEPGAAESGGVIDYFGEEDVYLAAPFREAAFALKEIGEYTKEAVQTDFGYHVIKLLDRREAGTQDFQEVKQELISYLLQEKKNEAFEQYLADFQKESKIESNI